MTDIPTFASLGLSPSALASLDHAGFTKPTPIQQRAIPPALAGRDLIGCAATGTGKTAAFVLPIVERLQGRRGPRALVLAPTRELALQISEHLELFGKARAVYGAVLIGGVGMEKQVQALREKRQVVIATPGRLIDHLERRTATLESIEILVLDEADRMLDMGFRPQLERILARLPKARQTMLFSATIAHEVAELAQRHLDKPVRVEIERSGTVAQRALQRVFHVPSLEKTALLLALLAESGESTLVFTRTKHRADRLCRALSRAGHQVARIHGDRTQGQRQKALEGFRNGDFRVLVATDIAARGLDVEQIGHVVNYDLPQVPEDYVHRVGRTARAAASGRASSFCSPEEQPLLRDIERLTRRPVPTSEVPRDSPVFVAELAKLAERKANAPTPRPAGRGATGSAREPERSRKPGPRAKGPSGGPASTKAGRLAPKPGTRPAHPAKRAAHSGGGRSKRRG